MPPKTSVTLDLVLKDMQPGLFGASPRYRVEHRNGAVIEGKFVSVGEESVRFKDSRGLVEIEKAYIARIDKAAPHPERERYVLLGAVALLIVASVVDALAARLGELSGILMPAAFAAAILTVVIGRVALRRFFTTWESVYPPFITDTLDDEGFPDENWKQ